MPTDARTAQDQVVSLAHDSSLVHKTLESHLAKNPPTADTDDAAQFLAVTGDLWRIVIQHCNATAYLLHEDIVEPAAVVYRAAYETMVTLNYILNRPTRDEQVEAALLHFAYSRLEIAKWFAGHPSAVDAERVLNIMPLAVVEKARRHHRGNARPRGPFGLSLKQTAEAAGFTGHDWNYAVLSWEGHARIAGDHIQRGATDERGAHELKFSRRVDPPWKWALANQARRFLHGTYEAVARAWLGAIPPLQTTDPRKEAI